MSHSHHDHTHCHAPVASDTPLGKKHARALKIVLGINAVMAVVEGASGYFARSSSLLADTLDMASDAVGAGAGLIVRRRSKKWQAGVALAKAAVMGGAGLAILTGAVLAIFNPVMPLLATMGIIGGLAFAANAACVAVLYPYRNDNINIKSTMMCSRGDMVSNIGVLAAAGVAYLIASPLPDIIVGAIVSGIFIKSAIAIGIESIRILRAPAGEEKKEAENPARTQQPEPGFGLRLKSALSAIFKKVSNPQAKTKDAPVIKTDNTCLLVKSGDNPAKVTRS